MSKSIFNKDWEEFVKMLTPEQQEALKQYDEAVFKAQQRKPFIVCSASLAEELQKLQEQLNEQPGQAIR